MAKWLWLVLAVAATVLGPVGMWVAPTNPVLWLMSTALLAWVIVYYREEGR